MYIYKYKYIIMYIFIFNKLISYYITLTQKHYAYRNIAYHIYIYIYNIKYINN